MAVFLLLADQLPDLEIQLDMRESEHLREASIRTAIIDLTRLGTKLLTELWYLGLMDEKMNLIAKNDFGNGIIKKVAKIPVE